jgi:hypothetical protein
MVTVALSPAEHSEGIAAKWRRQLQRVVIPLASC